MHIIGCYPYEYGWIAERTGCEPGPSFKAIKAMDDTGRIHGMVGYSDWTANSVIMYSAIDNPACGRELIKFSFWYPFVQAKRNIALGMVRAKNTKAMRLNKHLGFREAYRVKDGIDIGEDLVIFEMRADECRWIDQSQRKVA
jgi:hypothetical protein